MSCVLAGLTPQQVAACCTDHGRWLAVSAGAGSGKTRVLAARILCLLERGEPLTGIVAMTFTRKAAQEMQTRVRRMLDERIAELEAVGGEGDALANLSAAREEFHRNRITTIDSFCRTQLLAASLEAGLPPGFDQLDEFAEAQARADAVDAMLSEYAPRMRALADGADDPGAAAMLELHRWFGADGVDGLFSGMLAREDQWRAAMESLGIGDGADPAKFREGEAAWIAGLADSMRELREAAAESMPWEDATGTGDPAKGVGILRSLAKEVGREPSAYLKWGEWFLAFVRTLPDDGLPSAEWATAIGELPRGTGPGKRAKELLEQRGCEGTSLTALKNAVRDAADALAIDEGLERRWFRVMATAASLLPELKRHFEEARGEGLTFSELKRLLLRFVTPGPAEGAMPARSPEAAMRNARSVAGGIRWLMVDEFQDTDPAQWQLFTRLLECQPPGGHREGINLFVVGDDKQSIYRFRGADASVFEQARRYIAEHNASLSGGEIRHPLDGGRIPPAPGPGGQLDAELAASGLIRLTANFRSRSLPLLAGNCVFGRMFRLLDWETGEPSRDHRPFDAPPQDLECGNSEGEPGEPQPFVRMVPFVPPRGDAEDEGDNGGEAGRSSGQARVLPTGNLAEARLCAGTVRSLREEGRIRQWSDAVVLVATNGQADFIRDALAAQGIPYAVSGGKGLLRRQETHDLWALAAAISNPDDDLAVTALLRSPLCGVTDEGLLAFRHAASGGSHRRGIWQCLRDSEAWRPAVEALDARREANGHAGAGDAERLELAHERLQRWRGQSEYTRPTDLVRDILNSTGSPAHGAGPGFSQRNANLCVLEGLFRTMEARGATLADCAGWLRERLDTEDLSLSEGQPEVDHATGGGVNVMTIHQAKGKEFGTVIMPFLGSRQNSFRDMPETFGTGTGNCLASLRPAWNQPGDDTEYVPLASRLIDFRNHAESKAEARRLLYVGWTRAIHGLVLLVPAIPATKSGNSNAGDVVPHPDPAGRYCLADLLCAALGVRRGEEHLAEDLRMRLAGVELPASVSNPGTSGAAREALTMVECTDLAEPGTMPLAHDLRRRELVAAMARGMVPAGSGLGVMAGLSDRARWLVAPVSAETAEPEIPQVVEVSPGTLREFVLPPVRQDDPVEEWLHSAQVGRTGLHATEFGTIVHEVARIALRSGMVRFSKPDAPGTAGMVTGEWLRSVVRSIAGRLRPGADVTGETLNALCQHGANVCRLMASRTCTGNMLLEHELVGAGSDRRLDCAIETAPGHWLIIDFKTSPAGSDRDREYAEQLQDYAGLLARYLSLAGQPPMSVSTVLLYTGNGGSWSEEKRHLAGELLAALVK